MQLKVDKDELIRLLEIILETQSGEDYTRASEILSMILLLPLSIQSVTINEQESLFLAKFV